MFTTALEPTFAVSRLDDWRVWQTARRLSPRTISDRSRMIARFAAETGQQPANVDAPTIVAWLHSHPEWSDATAATYHTYLASWFKYLQLIEHRPDNPMIKVGSPKRPDRSPRPISDEDLTRLLSTRMRRRTKIMILLACLAGLRVSEIARVRGEDIDLGARLIWVRGKGRTLRSIPLHPTLTEVASTMPQRGYWFPMHSCPGAPILGGSVSDTIRKVMRRAGVQGTPHALRHWYATTLLAEGADLRTVQECLRHKSVATTQIYTKVPDERRKAAIGSLDPLRWRTPQRRLQIQVDA